MIGESSDNSTGDSKSFASSESGSRSIVSSDEDNNWMMQTNEEAVDFLERMLFWLDSIHNFEQFMQKRIEDSEIEVVDEDPETEQEFEEL